MKILLLVCSQLRTGGDESDNQWETVDETGGFQIVHYSRDSHEPSGSRKAVKADPNSQKKTHSALSNLCDIEGVETVTPASRRSRVNLRQGNKSMTFGSNLPSESGQ